MRADAHTYSYGTNLLPHNIPEKIYAGIFKAEGTAAATPMFKKGGIFFKPQLKMEGTVNLVYEP